MTKQEVIVFRGEFAIAVQQLEKQFGVNISLGTITFDVNGLSAKMKAEKGEKIIRATKNDFRVGYIVGINHKTVDKNDEFEIVKINNKNIKVQKINPGEGRVGALMNVSPGLLILK